MSALTPRVAHHFAAAPVAITVPPWHSARSLPGCSPRCAAAGPKRFSRVLEAGCGTGHLSRHLSTLAPAVLWLNDPEHDAPPCPAPRRCPATSRRSHCPGPLDLVASSSMIQWLEDPGAVIARLAGAVAPGGILALSGFGPDHFPELRALGGCAGAPSCLNGAGLAAPSARGLAGRGRGQLADHAEVRQRACGVAASARDRGGARAGQIRSRGALLRFLHAYEDRFATARACR